GRSIMSHAMQSDVTAVAALSLVLGPLLMSVGGTFQSGPVLGAVMIGGTAFFLGVAAMAVPLIRGGGPSRWPALAFVAGALLIGGEIATAQVLLSQIGNLSILLRG